MLVCDMLFTLPVDSDSAAKQIFRNKSGGKIPAAVICFEACLRKLSAGFYITTMSFCSNSTLYSLGKASSVISTSMSSSWAKV